MKYHPSIRPVILAMALAASASGAAAADVRVMCY